MHPVRVRFPGKKFEALGKSIVRLWTTRPRRPNHILEVCPVDIVSPSVPLPKDSNLDRHLRFQDHRLLMGFAAVTVMAATPAHAAGLEQTLTNLVNAFTGRLLPILALGYLGKNIFSHIQGDPNAKHETIRVVIATACLLGLSGVWSYISQQAR